MYSTCPDCHLPLGGNAIIEACPIGRWLAIDFLSPRRAMLEHA